MRGRGMGQLGRRSRVDAGRINLEAADMKKGLGATTGLPRQPPLWSSPLLRQVLQVDSLTCLGILKMHGGEH